MSTSDDAATELKRQQDKALAQIKAKISIAPDALSAAVLEKWTTVTNPPFKELSAELREQNNAMRGGDLSRVEDMLLAQAHTLDGLFAALATRAANAPSVTVLEVYLRLALKAQSQSRATLQTLGELKAPKQVAFVGQANIGHQVQVNNGTSGPGANTAPAANTPRTRTRKNKTAQNKLMDADHEQRLDTRTPGTASGDDSALATVATQHRPQKRRGKSCGGA
ncbi:hypothetical protein ACIQVE_29200 [Pseudomonas sp. NPDC098747]|uniref:hypothetical protein n=1 Tax=Pseudomonas sp. NPDC098747 TaxID=3364487 RepID=UPI00383B43DA